MGWLTRGEKLPHTVRDAVGVGRGERILAHGVEAHRGATVVATTCRLVVVAADGAVTVDRPWWQVATGAWEPTTETISVFWEDGGRGSQWSFTSGGQRIAEAFFERVRASVYVDTPLVLDGREVGKAAIRRDLATGALRRQVVVARGVRRDDPAVTAFAAEVLDDLAEQAGMVE